MAKKKTAKRKTASTNHRKSRNADSARTKSELFVDTPYPYSDKMKKSEYESLLHKLHIELQKVQQWVKQSGEKIAIVFEGRDAAGKGGTIKRFTQYLNPRGAHVVALAKPNESERGQWYFQRYVANLPTGGEMTFFDRSWYNRAGVEPVMGFCTPEDYQRFIHHVAEFERAIIESGLRLFKLWFDVGRDEQKRRMAARGKDPLKRWKLTPMDEESMARWDDYTKARDAMFLYTDTTHSPWTAIRSDDKRRARIAAISTVLNRLPYPDKDDCVAAAIDPLIVGEVRNVFPLQGRFMFADSDK